ncbi:MAG: DNA repair protein RadC [Elusimicrobiota bacterium]|jgi:DNA repair protein RadC|nr:DNA repair protein RadC [Elusimicrobiota bacterium]
MDDQKQQPNYLGHRKRIKEKFLQLNFNDAFPNDYEKLEFALIFAMPRQDTKSIAKNLIDKFGTLKQAIDAPIEELCCVKGISIHTAIYIKFLKDFSALYSLLNIQQRRLLDSPKLVSDYFSSLLSGEKVEKLCMLSLDAGNKLIKNVILESGTVNRAVIQPRKIVEEALKNKAIGVIIAHNHPGGTLKPSQNDIEATKSVKDALITVDIVLQDHIIIAGSQYFSFREYGLI